MEKKVWLLIIGFSLLWAAQFGSSEEMLTIDSLTESVDFATGWRVIYAADKPEFATPDYNDSQWQPYKLNTNVKLAEQCYVWLRNYFKISEKLKGKSPILMIGKNEGACEIYVNGFMVGSLGHLPPHYYQTANVDRVIELPLALLSYDKPNSLAVRYFRNSSYFVFRDVKFINEQDRNLYANVSRFLNITLNQIFSGILLFVAIFMFFLYFKKRDNLGYLFFALGCLVFANYLAVFYLDFPIINWVYSMGFTQGTLTISLFFFILFQIFFVNVNGLKNRTFIILAACFTLVSFGGFFLQKDADGLAVWFNLSLLYLLFTLVTSLSVLVIGLRRGNKNALPIFIGMVQVLPMAGFDVYYSLTGIRPLTYLQGIGLIVFVMSMFYSLSNDIMNLSKYLAKNSSELLSNKTSLENVLSKSKTTSDKLTKLGTTLDENVSFNSQLIDEMITHNKELSETITNQAELLGLISKAIKEIIGSIAVVTDDIGSQSAFTAETSASMEQLAANVKSIHDLTQKAETIAEETTSLTVTGQQKIGQSTSAINELKKQADKIIEIIEIIDEISERTNLLAFNAAIEATRAGNAGKGFSIVAKEIRELAQNTRQGSQEIRGVVNNTLKEINGTVTHFGDIKGALDQILNIAQKTKSIVSEIFEATGEEQKGIGEIMKAVTELVRATEDIKNSSLEQKTKSEHISQSLSELESYTLRINKFIREQEKRNQQLTQENEKIKNVSKENLQISTELNESIVYKKS